MCHLNFLKLDIPLSKILHPPMGPWSDIRTLNIIHKANQNIYIYLNSLHARVNPGFWKRGVPDYQFLEKGRGSIPQFESNQNTAKKSNFGSKRGSPDPLPPLNPPLFCPRELWCLRPKKIVCFWLVAKKNRIGRSEKHFCYFSFLGLSGGSRILKRGGGTHCREG